MQFKGLNVRPMRVEDERAFDQLRRTYWEADLEIPKGWFAEGVETAVATEDNVPVTSLTSTLAVVLDPLIKNPRANPLTIVASIYLLERALTYEAQKHGAVDAYIAIPNQLTEYHAIVQKAGYVPTVENCTVYRRPLRPDTEPLLGVQRDAFKLQQASEPEPDPAPDTPTHEGEETAKGV